MFFIKKSTLLTTMVVTGRI